MKSRSRHFTRIIIDEVTDYIPYLLYLIHHTVVSSPQICSIGRIRTGVQTEEVTRSGGTIVPDTEQKNIDT